MQPWKIIPMNYITTQKEQMNFTDAFKSLDKLTSIVVALVIIVIGIILIYSYSVGVKYYEQNKDKSEHVETYDLMNKGDYNFMIATLVIGILVLLGGVVSGIFVTYNIFNGTRRVK